MKLVSDRCLSSLRDARYLNALQKLSKQLDADVWVIGGWARSAALGVNYVGDVDCLTSIRPELLFERLKILGIKFSLSNFGNPRLALLDGNHIDLISTWMHSDSDDIRQTISEFNFSINGIAISVGSGATIMSEHFFEDLKGRKFRVTARSRNFVAPQLRGLCKDFKILREFYGLDLVVTDLSEKLLQKSDALNIQSCSYDVEMKNAKAIVQESLNLDPKRCWIVRGYPRCALLNDLRFWDDIDIVCLTLSLIHI